MANENIVIIRTDRSDGKDEKVTFIYAVEKLKGYWKEDEIEKLLLSGETLYTPFAEYRVA